MSAKEMSRILNEQMEFFLENGYCIVKQALEADHVERLIRVVNELFEGLEGREVEDIIDRHEIFHPLLVHPPTFSIVKALMGKKVQMESVNATRVRPGK